MTAGPRSVRATARLQLHKDFPFAAAAERVRYFKALGVSHLYVSPILAARAGSTHGYDVIDHARINPELGGEEGLVRLVARLRDADMGLVVDIVPNHMAVGGDDNPWWLDVLALGKRSAYAGHFDIDWDVPDPMLRGKVLAPYLGLPYGQALAAGDIKLEWSERDARWQARYYAHAFPIAPGHLEGERDAILRAHDPATEGGRATLHKLLERQHYRLAWWQAARDEINWRRFFDLADYAGLRVEETRVFEQVHATTFRLVDEGLIDGVRVDHVDGLADPRDYCRRLRARIGPDALLVVEKILAPGERMPTDWRIDGTTGYSFMNDVGALLHDPAGAAPLTSLWSALTGRSGDFEAEARRARRRIADESLGAEVAACALALHRIARTDLATRDVSLAAIRRVLIEILVHFPVYRLYADRRGRSEAEASLMAKVCTEAREQCRPAERYLVDLVDRWLGAEPPAAVRELGARRLRQRAITRFQQLTSPLAAKSVEDTAFYRHGAILSRNEVGADPAQFALGPGEFHAECVRRREAFPRALLATATHDHKRGEDARARIAVLSERAQEWGAAVERWHALGAPLRQGDAPSPGDEYMLYQTLVGHWPFELSPDDAAGLAAYADRVCAWHLKAVREAKLRSSWIMPDAAYEEACASYTRALLEPKHGFTTAAHAFVHKIASAGAANALTQTLLRLTAPGIPDLYQSTELWDFSLVDPDNRRPVDYAARESVLRGDAPLVELLRDWRDGRIKQRLIATALALRARSDELFTRGEYLPLEVTGPAAGRVIAFARINGPRAALVAACRGVSDLIEPSEPRIASSHWGNAVLVLPPRLAPKAWRDVLEERLTIAGARIPVARILNDRSFALFEA
ncbi:MAG TPA: malto-oligosyltrehalose synthase [Verrucomicrobiae bacterium]|nr:malto-oligosyltrehalose synthase [Verrucomicrobiae bacterium]